jgi:hypothetical protein
MTVGNTDENCAIALMLGSYTMPGGWEPPEVSSIEATLMSGAEENYTSLIDVPANATAGQHTISMTVQDTRTGQETTFSATIDVTAR